MQVMDPTHHILKQHTQLQVGWLKLAAYLRHWWTLYIKAMMNRSRLQLHMLQIAVKSSLALFGMGLESDFRVKKRK